MKRATLPTVRSRDVMWKCVFAALTWCHCVYFWECESCTPLQLSCAVHPEICLRPQGLRITDTSLSEPLSCELRESVLRYDDISFSLFSSLSPPFPLSHSISALLPFQNLPLCLLISHSAAPPRACSVATAGAWTSSARPCPHVPAKMVLYHAMGSEGWVCPIALSLEEEEKEEEEEVVVEEQEHRERGWL